LLTIVNVGEFAEILEMVEIVISDAGFAEYDLALGFPKG
jgi:hypothetical protein